MSAHQIATLIIRLTALAWALYLLDRTGSLLIYLDQGRFGDLSILALNAAFILFQFCCAAGLWFYPATSAAKILPSVLADKPRFAVTAHEWQTIGIVCIGIWELARAIPDLAYWTVLLPQLLHDGGISNPQLTPMRIANSAVTVVELALGLWLVLGSEGLAVLLMKIRTTRLKITQD